MTRLRQLNISTVQMPRHQRPCRRIHPSPVQPHLQEMISRWYLVSLALSSGHSSGAADRLTVFVFRDLPAYGLRYQLGKFGPVVLKIMPKFPREVANKKSHPCAHDSSYGALAHFWYYNQVRLPFVCEKITTHGSVTFDLDATARLCTVTRPVDTCIIWKSMHCSCTVLEDVHFGQVWFRVT